MEVIEFLNNVISADKATLAFVLSALCIVGAIVRRIGHIIDLSHRQAMVLAFFGVVLLVLSVMPDVPSLP